MFLIGGMNFNGNIYVENGKLLLLGVLVFYVYDYFNKKEVIEEGNWINC